MSNSPYRKVDSSIDSVDPPPCNSGMLELEEDPNMITNILDSHHYWVGVDLSIEYSKPSR